MKKTITLLLTAAALTISSGCATTSASEDSKTGLAAGSSEVTFAASTVEYTYSDDVKPDTTTQINLGYSWYLTDAISLGVTFNNYDFEDEETLEEESSRSILFSPRYNFSFNDGRFAIYLGPDIGITDYKEVDDLGPFEVSETAIGGVLGLKSFLWDNMSLFVEYYKLTFDFEVDDPAFGDFDGEYEATGFRTGLSVFL